MKVSSEIIISEIEKSSKKIIQRSNDYKRQLGSTIYFVSNKKLNHWSISKEIACYTFNVPIVTDAKIFFFDNGFINILVLDNEQLRASVIEAFLEWSKPFRDKIDIASKFYKDQDGDRKIQLLIPSEILENGSGTNSNKQNKSPENSNHKEGQEKYIYEYKYNFRNRKLINEAKEKWKTNCWVCDFNFYDKYGDWGKDYIEIHHLIPLNQGKRVTNVEDVRPVCSNCHQMIHKRKEMLTIQELKNIIKEVKNKKDKT